MIKKAVLSIFSLVCLTLIILISSCSTSSRMTQLNQKGDMAYKEGDNTTALQAFEQSIAAYEKSGKQKACPVYTKAGQIALDFGQDDKALNYFEKARYTVSENENTYLGLSTCYRKIDNLSKEMDALQTYLEKYPEGKEKHKVNNRLFEIYTESENWKKAVDLWPQVKAEVVSNQKFMQDYFIVNQALNNDKVCDSLSKALLRINKNNPMAIKWKAKKYYRRAENLYQKEMKAYEKHKTRKQYVHLLKALDNVTANFKISLRYFKKLYKSDPQAEYARYLANIYNRLDDKEKAKYYKKRSER